MVLESLCKNFMGELNLNFKLLFIGSLLCSSAAIWAEPLDLETFESLSANIKNKKTMSLQDESPLRVLLQYNQPQRKIQATVESSESSLSTE